MGRLFSPEGDLLMERMLGENGGEIQVPETWPSGVYQLVAVLKDGGVFTNRVVVKR